MNLLCMMVSVTGTALVLQYPIVVIELFYLQDTLFWKGNLFQLLPRGEDDNYRLILVSCYLRGVYQSTGWPLHNVSIYHCPTVLPDNFCQNCRT